MTEISLGNGPFVATGTVEDEPDHAIPLTSSITMKFYEPIMLYKALIDVVANTATSSTREPPINIRNDKQLFHAFVNKLGHICDKTKGGGTVTSFMILCGRGDGDVIDYLFAANKQKVHELEETASFIRRVLIKTRSIPEEPSKQHKIRKSLLYDILRFNRSRVSIYMELLQSQVIECLRRCNTEKAIRSNESIVQELTAVCKCLGSVKSCSQVDCSEEEDIYSTCLALIRLLIPLEKSEAGKEIIALAEEGRSRGMPNTICWSNLLHTINRILAYPKSVHFMMLAKQRWPQLFRKPRVSFVPSSERIRKPVRNKSLTADGIVGRMTRKEKQIKIFRDFVLSLQAYDLDHRIKAEYGRDSFKPHVHSEVLLLNWLEYHGGIDPARFFNGWMYIGGSKPMCKLCYYYFEEHKSGVEHRPCHGNLYPSWRIPDVLQSQGPAAVDARQIMVDRVLQRVRKDAFDVVRKKVMPTYKDDDSNTFSASVEIEERWTLESSAMDIDDTTTLVDQLSFADDAP